MAMDKFASMIAGLESVGLTRTQIAEGSGISRMTVWRLAEGEARRPSFETIERLKTFEAAAREQRKSL